MPTAATVDTRTYFLYVKVHRLTGLRYLGRTQRNPYSYQGSGTYWKRHLKKYGSDVETHILLKTENFEELSEVGIFFSRLFDVVNSKEFANLCEENGSGGVVGYTHTPERLKKIGEASVVNNLYMKRSTETRKKISESLLGEKNPNFGKRGAKRSEIAKEKMSKRAKLRKLVQCPYCGKEMPRSANRWHFNNCKERKNQ